MHAFRASIDRLFSLPLLEGEDNVCSPTEALRLLRPGMSVHVGCTHGRPYGLLYELIRLFWGQRPDFEIVSLGFTGPFAALVHGRLARRCVSTFYGDSYPTPGPNRVYQDAYLAGDVAFRHWSILTLPLRLKAAAMGVPGLPTHSVAGSSMAEQNAEALRLLRFYDPDGQFLAKRRGGAATGSPQGRETEGG